MVMGQGHLTCEATLSRVGLISLGKRWLWGDLRAVCLCLQGGYQEGRAKIFMEVDGGKMRNNNHKLKQERSGQDTKGKFFPLEVSQIVGQVARDSCALSILGGFRFFVSSLVCFAQVLGLKIFRGPFPPEFSCNPVISDVGSVFSLDVLAYWPLQTPCGS